MDTSVLNRIHQIIRNGSQRLQTPKPFVSLLIQNPTPIQIPNCLTLISYSPSLSVSGNWSLVEPFFCKIVDGLFKVLAPQKSTLARSFQCGKLILFSLTEPFLFDCIIDGLSNLPCTSILYLESQITFFLCRNGHVFWCQKGEPHRSPWAVIHGRSLERYLSIETSNLWWEENLVIFLCGAPFSETRKYRFVKLSSLCIIVAQNGFCCVLEEDLRAHQISKLFLLERLERFLNTFSLECYIFFQTCVFVRSRIQNMKHRRILELTGNPIRDQGHQG